MPTSSHFRNPDLFSLYELYMRDTCIFGDALTLGPMGPEPGAGCAAMRCDDKLLVDPGSFG